MRRWVSDGRPQKEEGRCFVTTFSILFFAVSFLVLTFAVIRVSLSFSEAIDDIKYGIESLRVSACTSSVLLDLIRSSLHAGVTLKAGQRLDILYPYVVILYFDDETVTIGIAFVSDIGHDDEIEIIPDTDDEMGLTVVFDNDCYAFHSASSATQLHIPVNCSIDTFRERLLSDGWQITSPESGGSDDEVLPSNTQAVCQG
jgi:hypothetical protein